MQQLTLQQLFGVNVIQNSQTLIIQKSDLPQLTLTPNGNTAEALFAAILLKALENFQGSILSQDNQVITDEYSNPITFKNGDVFIDLHVFTWNPYIANRLNQYFVRNSLIVQSFILSKYAD